MADQEELNLEQMIRRRDLLAQLQGSESFILWSKYVLDGVEAAKFELMNTQITPDEVLIQEFKKGKANGMLSAIELLDVVVSDLEDSIKTLTLQRRREEEDARDRSDGDTDEYGEPLPDDDREPDVP